MAGESCVAPLVPQTPAVITQGDTAASLGTQLSLSLPLHSSPALFCHVQSSQSGGKWPFHPPWHPQPPPMPLMRLLKENEDSGQAANSPVGRGAT